MKWCNTSPEYFTRISHLNIFSCILYNDFCTPPLVKKISRTFAVQWRVSAGISEKGFAYTPELLANAGADFSVLDAAEMVLSLLQCDLLAETISTLCTVESRHEDRRRRDRRQSIIFLQVSNFIWCLTYPVVFLPPLPIDLSAMRNLPMTLAFSTYIHPTNFP